jgi:hypothetical protein
LGVGHCDYADRDVVGTRVLVRANAGGSCVDVAPCHHGVDQPVGERADVVVGEAHSAKTGLVGGEPRQGVQPSAGELAGPSRVRLENDQLLDGQRGVAPQPVPGLGRVLRRHEHREGTGGSLPREVEHAWPQGRHHPRSLRYRTGLRVQPVEVAPKGRQRVRAVCSAQPDDEATAVARLEVRIQSRHVVGREPVDRDYPAGDPRPLGGPYDLGDLVQVGERTTSEPDRGIPHCLQRHRGVHQGASLSGAHHRADGTKFDPRHPMTSLDVCGASPYKCDLPPPGVGAEPEE